MLLEQSILPGTPGTAETIMAMRKAVSRGKRLPQFILLAGELVQGCPHKDRECWTKQAWDYVHRQVAYVNHPFGIEVVMDADKTLARGAGDCDQQSVLFNTIVEAMGLRSWFKTVAASPLQRPGEWTHVYSMVDVPGVGRVAADCTEGGGYLGWEPTGYRGQLWPGSME